MPNAHIVCILGMHRSGTSAVSRILNLMGYYLGPEEHLIKPSQSNPKGHWEHQILTNLNNKILERFGGSWDKPPTFPPNWEHSLDLEDIRDEAKRTIRDEFGSANMWAWKDPRICLTLPFWQQFLPPMLYVICLRNPIDVAYSLERRNRFTFDKSLNLWLTYVKSSLEYTVGQPRLILFYEDLIDNLQLELQRLHQFLKRPKQKGLQRQVEKFIEKDLHHHRSTIMETVKEVKITFPTKAFFTILRLYVDLKRKEISEKDTILHEVLNAMSQISLKAHIDMQDKNNLITVLQTELDAKNNTALKIQSNLQEKDNIIAKLQSDLQQMSGAVLLLRSELQDKARTVTMLESKLKNIELTKSNLDSELEAIKSSFGYRVMKSYATKIDSFSPEGTRRGRFRKYLVNKFSKSSEI